MPTKHHHEKPLGFKIIKYIILFFVSILGLYLLKPFLPVKQIATKPSCTYDKDVCEYLLRLKDPATYAGPFTISITQKDPDNHESRIIIRTDRKNNLEIVTYENSKLTGNSSIIDNIVYKRDLTTNIWNISKEKVDPTFYDIKEKSLEQVFKISSGASYKFIGESPCGNIMCIKYQLIPKNTPHDTTHVLFTPSTHMVKEIIKESADDTTTSIRFVYTDVTITPPVLR